MREVLIQAGVYVFEALLLVILGLVGNYVRYALRKLKIKVGEAGLQKIIQTAEIIVKAMEQKYNLPKMGEQKKKEAIAFIMYKFKLSEKEAEMFVEAAVRDMKYFEKEITDYKN